MSSPRRIVLDWAEQGHIAATDLVPALAVVDALPSHAAWRRFLDQLLLWTAVLLVGAGVIFFFAFNWSDIDRFTKFALTEALVVGALVLVWRLGVDRASGKGALVGASVFIGALLALIGQTYQTGADSYELFGTWAVMMLPWTIVGRFGVLWLLWLLVTNLAIVTYFQAFPTALSSFIDDQAVWVMFGVNTAALAMWEVAGMRGVEWLRPRWAPRLIATASGGLVTTLAIIEILNGFAGELQSPDSAGIVQAWRVWAMAAWLAWIAGAWVVYRHTIKDLFVLAGGVLSVILVVATLLGKQLIEVGDAFAASLLIGVVVIALSAAGGMWLRRVAERDE